MYDFRGPYYQTIPMRKIFAKTKKPLQISAHTDGGPRSQVCACKTLRSAPINIERKLIRRGRLCLNVWIILRLDR